MINVMKCLCSDNLSEALEKLKLASSDSTSDSTESCLDCLLKSLANNSEYKPSTGYKLFALGLS